MAIINPLSWPLSVCFHSPPAKREPSQASEPPSPLLFSPLRSDPRPGRKHSNVEQRFVFSPLTVCLSGSSRTTTRLKLSNERTSNSDVTPTRQKMIGVTADWAGLVGHPPRVLRSLAGKSGIPEFFSGVAVAPPNKCSSEWPFHSLLWRSSCAQVQR